MTRRRIVKWLAGLSGSGVVLLVAAVLLLPRFLDSQAMREKIRAFLLARTNGNVTIERIDLAWFPRPVVVAHGASLAFDDTVSGTIRSIEIRPSVRGLLTGHISISRVTMTSPTLAIRLPEPTEAPPHTDQTEGQIRALLASVAANCSGMTITVRDGSAEFRIGERPPLAITDVGGRLVAPPGELDVQLHSRATVFDSLRVEARIKGQTLATQARIHVENLRLRETMASLMPGPHDHVESGAVSLNLSLSAAGLKKITVEIEGVVPSLALVRKDRKTVIEGSAFMGRISRDEGIVNAVIERLDIAAPRLTASGRLTVDPGSSAVRLKLVGRGLDVSRVRESALQLAADIGFIETAFRYLGGGAIPEIGLETSGASFAELWRPNSIAATATLRDGKLFLPGPDLALEDVSGSIVVSGGMLEAKSVSATLGTIRGGDGTLRLGLEGPHAPFHLELTVRTDAAELQALLLRVVQADDFRKQLSRLRNVAGTLSGLLVLGETIDSLSPKVSILKTALRSSHDLIPYPISINGGRFEYGNGRVTLKDVSGTVGRSSFSGLTGALSDDGPRQIEVVSGRFALDVAQTTNMLNHFRVLPEPLSDIDSAQGGLDLTSLFLKGPLDDPRRWEFTIDGALDKIVLRHAALPGAMYLSGGTFRATPAVFTISATKVDVLDASLTVDGSLESSDMVPLGLEAAATGSIGAEMAGWMSRQIGLPDQLLLRSPLQPAKGRVSWKKDGDVGVRGELTVARGPHLSLDVVRAPHAVEVKEILIADGERRARMTLDLALDRLAFSFDGALEQSTLNRILQTPPPVGSLIQGEFDVSAYVEEPLRFSARGRLAGRELRVPLKTEPAVIESFFAEADQNGVHVRSADVRWRNSRLSFLGTLAPETKGLRLEMDIAADKVVGEEIRELLAGGGNRESNGGMSGIALPPVVGTVRLKADTFTVFGFDWKPFHAAVSLSPHGIGGTIERGDVCGIGAEGRVDFADGVIGLDLRLSVTDGQLEPTSLCLTGNTRAVTGGYSLQAQIAGRGTPETVAQTLRGEFGINVQDGRFVQLANPDSHTPLEAAFDYLNATDDFSVAFPDLHRESFPFRSVRYGGMVEGMTLVNTELAIQSSLFVIAADGTVDLEHKYIDARGLVSVRMPGGSVIRRMPIVGSIFGGSILGIPVRVRGSLERPEVTYLAPADVGTQLLRVPARILSVPVDAIRVFTPSPRVPETR